MFLSKRAIEIHLDEKGIVPSKIQVIRTGKWRYGFDDMMITPETLKSFKRNFDNKVRGYTDGKLPVDYFHMSYAEAAGWMTSLYLENNDTELWAEVEWTDEAKDKITNRKIRYVSAEFMDNYRDDEDQKEYGPTLFGAGLTNRPFIKEMSPLTLSENNQVRYKMDLEQAKAKNAELETQLNEAKAKNDTLAAEIATLKGDLAKQTEKIALQEKTNVFNKMFAEGKVVEAQREAYIANDMVKFAELAKPVNKGAGSDDVPAAEGKASEKILKLAEEQKKPVSVVLDENPELRKQYEAEIAI